MMKVLVFVKERMTVSVKRRKLFVLWYWRGERFACSHVASSPWGHGGRWFLGENTVCQMHWKTGKEAPNGGSVNHCIQNFDA